MALIQFVHNYDDLSTDRGYQFKFHCDKCGNGYMTQFQASTLGIAESLLNVASDFLSGWGRAGSAPMAAANSTIKSVKIRLTRGSTGIEPRGGSISITSTQMQDY